MNRPISTPTFARTFALLCTLSVFPNANATPNGIAGSTGASSNCTSCHTTPDPADPFPSTGDLAFPAIVTNDTFVAGKSYELSFTNTGAAAAVGAGFNLGDSLGVSLFSNTDANTVAQSSGAEISHANATEENWTFNWESDELTGSAQFEWCTMRTDGTAETGDGAESCSTQAFSVVANQPPVAAAGADQAIDEGSLVSLDAGASTDEFPDLAYAWTQTAGPTVTLTGADTANPTFTAPNVELAGDSVTFSVTVTEVDHDDLSDSDEVVVSINNVNQDPVANAGPDQSVAESTVVTLDGSASTDPDVGDSLSYAWLQTGGTAVTLSSTTVPSPTFTAPVVAAGGELLTFQLTVTDGASASNANSVNISVANTNQPPVAYAGPDQTVNELSSVNLSAAGTTDETPGSLTYSWIQISGPPSFTSRTKKTATFTSAAVGFDTDNAIVAELTVTDSFGLTSTDTVVITVTNVNQPPVADAGSDQTVGENISVALNGTASTDPDLAQDDVLTYAWTQTAGDSVALAGADTATPTFQSPNVAGAGGSSTFLLTVTDRGLVQSTDSVVVNFTDGNTSPVADAGLDQTVDEGATVALSAAASTDDVPATLQYAWTQTGGPSVTITDAATSSASVVAPEVGFDGLSSITLTLTVTDEEGLTSTDTVSVNVNNVNLQPTADAGVDQSVGENVTVSLSAVASTDPDLAVDDELGYAWVQTDGVAVTLIGADTDTPTFQSPNVPSAGATATFMLTVTDRGLLQSSDSVVISIADGNLSPVANAGPDQVADEGSVVALSATASTDDVPASLEYLWTQTGGAAVALTGATTETPSFTAPEVGFDSAGVITFSLTVTDEEGLTSSDTVLISISNLNLAPTADAGSDQVVGEQVVVSLNGSASTDPDLAVDDVLAYSWTQTAGAPLSLTGADTQSPTFVSPEVSADGESATFTLTVTDRGSLQSTDLVTVSFTNGNTSPVANAGANQTVNEGSLVTLSGAASTDDVLATVQYAWTQTGGPSVTLSGADTVAPSFAAPDVGFDGAKQLTFTLTLTDEENLSGSDSVLVDVTNVNQPPVADAGSDQIVSEETAVSLNGLASSDPDVSLDDVLSYAWIQTGGLPVALAGADTATPTFQAPSVVGNGESSAFSLTVTDRGLLQSTDTVVVSYSAIANLAPTVDAGTSVEVVEQMAVTLDGSNSSDVDGTIALYQWTQIAGPEVALMQSDSAVTSFTAPEVSATGETLQFELRVTDNEDSSAAAVVEIYVRDTAGVMAPVASVLPSSRSAQVFGEVGAFATIINPSNIPLTECSISPITSVPADFAFFATDPATNAIVGDADTPVDIAANAAQTFVLFFTPTAAFEPTDVEIAYECGNSFSTEMISDVNTLLLSAADTATADVIALVASSSQDGVVRIPGASGSQAFGVATANVGEAAEIVATAETSNPDVNVVLSICESNPLTGACLAGPGEDAVTTVEANSTATYSVFVTATGNVAFDPATTRIRVLFKEDGVVRGSTSIAVLTE